MSKHSVTVSLGDRRAIFTPILKTAVWAGYWSDGNRWKGRFTRRHRSTDECRMQSVVAVCDRKTIKSSPPSPKNYRPHFL